MQAQHAKHMTDAEQETKSLAKNALKDDDIANSNTSSETLQQHDIIHVFGDIIHVGSPFRYLPCLS